MAHHAFNVAELFTLQGRGVVVVTDKTFEQLGPSIAVKIGDSIEFRKGNEVVLRSSVQGIEHCDPWSPQRPFVFLLPPEVRQDDVPVGSEIWLDDCSLING